MLGRKYEYKLRYNDNIIIDLNFNMSTLMNMFDLFGHMPSSILVEFLDEKDLDVQVIIMAQMIYCMTDGSIPIGSLINDIFKDEEDIENVRESLIKIYFLEFSNEYPSKKKDKLDIQIEEEYMQESDDEDDEDYIEEEKSNVVKWNDFWNYYYYLALYQLRISYKEFLKMSVRELDTLNMYHSDYIKVCILKAYGDIEYGKHKASFKSEVNNKSPKEVKLSANGKNGARIKDLLVR